MSFAKRLSEAMRRNKVTQRAFAEELRRAGVRGSSRKSIYSYLDGATEPFTKAWYKAAAGILEVEQDWLELGEGPMVRAWSDNEDPKCATCAYWLRTNESEGTCRRRAPSVSEHSYVASWPVTLANQWCGEYSP